MSFNAIRENKIFAKISELTVYLNLRIYSSLSCLSLIQAVDQVREKTMAMEKRRNLVRLVCNRTGQISGKTFEVSGTERYNLSYCLVQKAGCTIWLRLFKFLNGQNPQTGPLSIGKYEVHYVKSNLNKLYKDNGQDGMFVSKSLRAMTVRDPYTRLWSAYIDKLLLPDFWFTKGKIIIQRTRVNPSALSLKCGFDVTFKEFIDYVTSTGHSFAHRDQDKHWLPASDICDPCVFKPDIINKQETFLDDLKYTLRESNMADMTDLLIAKDPMEYEIKDEIDYNFKVFYQFTKCINRYNLSKLIWIALTLNGYIPVQEPFPANISENSLNSASLYEMVKRVRDKHKVTRADVKRARYLALKTAYSQISNDKLQLLKELYRNDFELFEYNNSLEYLGL